MLHDTASAKNTSLWYYLLHKAPQALWDMDMIYTDHKDRTSYSHIQLKDMEVYKLTCLQDICFFSTCCQQVHFRKHKLICQIFYSN